MDFVYDKKILFSLIFILSLAFTRNPGLRMQHLKVAYVYRWINGNFGQVINYRRVEFKGLENNRIIGGHRANIKDYPFMAYLAKTAAADWGNFRGGASIVSSHWALTAAHCMLFISDYEIEEGRAFVRGNTSFWKWNYTEHMIVKSIVHELYDTYTNDYDIALLKVDSAFDGKYERPIPLVDSDYEYDVGSEVTALGWGTTDADIGSVSDELNYVDVHIIDHGKCHDLLGGESTLQLTDRMVCAMAPGKDACVYDSGGPLIQNGLLIGIVSWGPIPCADPTEPGVYTKVSYFSSWIRRTMTSN
ncbi:hypothetical protein ILUMI_01679 [Ignelater luminosus]|uniref:Peptidase S1 domain-containing protein n=1 Tax=Ignelater luminosus TaxID=2038154 RepID=A0A8K0DHU8_IGNLU|nr:hypothetical protein ILUMI_01679 [Ignelater luminosus]